MATALNLMVRIQVARIHVMPTPNHPEMRTQAELTKRMRHQVHLRRHLRTRNLFAKRQRQEKHFHQVRKVNRERKTPEREKGGDVGEELLLAAAVAVVEKTQYRPSLTTRNLRAKLCQLLPRPQQVRKPARAQGHILHRQCPHMLDMQLYLTQSP